MQKGFASAFLVGLILGAFSVHALNEIRGQNSRIQCDVVDYPEVEGIQLSLQFDGIPILDGVVSARENISLRIRNFGGDTISLLDYYGDDDLSEVSLVQTEDGREIFQVNFNHVSAEVEHRKLSNSE